MDTGEAVIDDSDDESDALFTMDDVLDGTTDTKKQNTDEVREGSVLCQKTQARHAASHVTCLCGVRDVYCPSLLSELLVGCAGAAVTYVCV